jgi:hypothetical protein
MTMQGLQTSAVDACGDVLRDDVSAVGTAAERPTVAVACGTAGAAAVDVGVSVGVSVAAATGAISHPALNKATGASRNSEAMARRYLERRGI